MAKNEKNAPPAEPEAAQTPEEKPAPPAKGGNMKLIIIVVIAMLVGGIGAFGAIKVLGGGSSAPVEEPTEEVSKDAEPKEKEEPIEAPKRDNADKEASKKGEAEAGAEGEEGAEEVFIPQNIELKPFVANLGSSGGRKFLKLTMSVEVDTQELSDEVNQKMPQFRDTILLLLSSLSYDDIATLDGKQRLRSQVLNRINSQLSTGKVKNIYFSEFVMQ